MEVLIKWHELPNNDASWEPLSTIRQQFVDLHLGDKVIADEGEGGGESLQTVIDLVLTKKRILEESFSHRQFVALICQDVILLTF